MSPLSKEDAARVFSPGGGVSVVMTVLSPLLLLGFFVVSITLIEMLVTFYAHRNLILNEAKTAMATVRSVGTEDDYMWYIEFDNDAGDTVSGFLRRANVPEHLAAALEAGSRLYILYTADYEADIIPRDTLDMYKERGPDVQALLIAMLIIAALISIRPDFLFFGLGIWPRDGQGKGGALL
jgi:hypothetical protein